MSVREMWGRAWPSLLAVGTVAAVGGPAAVASWRHARDVITDHGDPVMAGWLALTTDGMLVAALVVIWVRRHRGAAAGKGPLGAFWAGMAATLGANLAAAHPTFIGVVVALWPPVCLAITLELVALVAHRTAPSDRADRTDRTVADLIDRTGGPAPVHADLEVVQTAVGPADHPALEPAPGPADRADRTGGPDRPEPAPDLRSDRRTTEPDRLLDEVVRWAADRDRPATVRAVRDHFHVGRDRAVRLLNQMEANRPCSTDS